MCLKKKSLSNSFISHNTHTTLQPKRRPIDFSRYEINISRDRKHSLKTRVWVAIVHEGHDKGLDVYMLDLKSNRLGYRGCVREVLKSN